MPHEFELPELETRLTELRDQATNVRPIALSERVDTAIDQAWANVDEVGMTAMREHILAHTLHLEASESLGALKAQEGALKANPYVEATAGVMGMDTPAYVDGVIVDVQDRVSRVWDRVVSTDKDLVPFGLAEHQDK